MGLDDAGVQRGEIQGGNGDIVVAPGRLNDRGTFVLLLRRLGPDVGDDQLLLQGLSAELAEELDLLASRKQKIEGDARDSGHFRVVFETRQLVHEALREVGILETVESQSAP